MATILNLLSADVVNLKTFLFKEVSYDMGGGGGGGTLKYYVKMRNHWQAL